MSIFSIGGGLGPKSAFFFEILAAEMLLLDEKPPFLDNSLGIFNEIFTSSSIFQASFNGMFKFSKMKILTF
jgi:hypothetical protein